MPEIYPRIIKKLTGSGNAGGTVTIKPSTSHRIHKLLISQTYAGGTNTVAAAATNITSIRAYRGNRLFWLGLTGTEYRDYRLLNGTGYDYSGLPNTATNMTLSFAEDWFLDTVQDSLAYNPLQQGELTIELDYTATTSFTAIEYVSDDAKIAPSSGLITLETIKPNAIGTDGYIEEELKKRGRLIQASFYPSTTGTVAISNAALLLGKDEVVGHDLLNTAQLLQSNNQAALASGASGRTANVYDMVFVKGDALSHAVDLAAWGAAKFRLQAATATGGTINTVLARLE